MALTPLAVVLTRCTSISSRHRFSSLLLVVACSLTVVLQTCHAGAILRRQQVRNGLAAAIDKRVADGNPCPDAEKPFPCKSTATCIPMGYLCDSNVDCEDGYDENEELCAAANRPPIEDILNFLQSEKGWIMKSLFAGRNVAKVAHGLAVSGKVEDFRQRLGMTPAEAETLKEAMKAIEDGDSSRLVDLGMPPSSWNEVSFIFSKLIKNGFTK